MRGDDLFMIKIITYLVAVFFLLVTRILLGEDIDLFKGGGALDPSPPNVLIILDNTSNWSANNQAWKKTDVSAKCSGNATCLNYVNQIFGNNSSLTQGQVEVSSLKLVLNELICSANSTQALKINVGLMMIKPTKGAYTNNAGTTTSPSEIAGLLRRAVMRLDSTRCPIFLADLDFIFNNITDPVYKAPADANYGGPFFDAFKYFGGYTNPAGATLNNAGSPVGYISFGPKRYGTIDILEENAAFTDSTKLIYSSPVVQISQNACGYNNYILLIGNGYPNADNLSLLSGLGYTYSSSLFAFSDRTSDVWAKFLSTTDVSPIAGQQSVATSVMNVYNASPDLNQTKLLKSMARYGNGFYYEVGGSLGGLINSFKNFFTSINAANQAFAPSTLPSTLSGGGQDLNQVYIGMFRPDKNPLWYGNLKHYQYVMQGLDAEGKPVVILGDSQKPPEAVQSGSGFVGDDVISYWTHSSSFWAFRCDPNNTTGDPLLCGTPLSSSDSPDGAVVEKGGAGQKLRDAFTADTSNSVRKVFTDNGSGLIVFNTTNVTASDVGVATTTERDSLVNWARGVDNIGENTSAMNGARPSITGDVLHSQPVAVNYGVSGGGCSSSSSGRVITFYATNHGFLHAVRGGITEGNEAWSYIPKDFLAQIKRLRDNSPAVTFPAPVPVTEFNKPYTIDGSLSVYAPDNDRDCLPDKVWLFLSMRRGGRYIYALDVTDVDNPRLLWRKTFSDTGLTELGQSWSRLKPILLPDSSSSSGKPYLLFGAGYDPNAEDRPFDTTTTSYGIPVTSARSMGRGIFVIDAENGSLKHFFQAGNFSVPSDVAVVRNDNNDFAERAYVGDTGGDIWKMIFPLTADAMSSSSNWTITKIASLGDPSDITKTGANARAFLYPPDIARCGGRDVILIGSGDREKPFDTVVQNRFYGIYDGNTDVVLTADLTDVTTLGSTLTLDADGWFFNLESGEKTAGGAVTTEGTTYFPTNKAADNTGSDCSNTLGTGRMYGVSCLNGGASVYSNTRYEVVPGGGFPPSPIISVVKLTDSETGDSYTVKVVSSGSHVASGQILTRQREFTYWYREGLD